MNPMIQKELRQRLRERRGWIIPTIYLVVLGSVITTAYYFAADSQQYSALEGANLGTLIFITTALTQLSILLLIAPVFSAAAVTSEKEQRTLSSLLVTLLSPAQIWWGKFISSLLFSLLLLVCASPFMAVALSFGGVGLWELFSGSLTTAIILGTMSSIGLYWSVTFRRTVHATAATYATIIALTVVTFVVFLVLMSVSDQEQQNWQWEDRPYYLRLPLYLNPFFFLASGFAPPELLFPDWVISLAFFGGIGMLCAGLAMRQLARLERLE